MRPHSAAHAALLRARAVNFWIAPAMHDAAGTLHSFYGFGPNGRNLVKEVRWDDSIDRRVISGTLTLMREWVEPDGTRYSLAPTHDALQPPWVSALGPMVAEGRYIKLTVAATPANQSGPTLLAGESYPDVLEGFIDEIEYGKRKSEIVITFRDLGGRLLDLTIQEERAYGANDGSATIASVCQQIIADNWDVATMGAAPVLYEPVPADFGVFPFKQQRKSVLEALNDVAEQAGLVVRYKYDALGQFRLTLFDPQRDKDVPDAAFGPGEYIDIPTMKRGTADVRNIVRVIYTDADGARQSVTQSDPDSIDAYGPKFMELGLDSATLIRTEDQANGLANAALSDLSTPLAAHQCESFLFWPVELGDLYAYAANDVQYDATQNLAVLGYEHVMNTKGTARTTITTRGKVAGSLKRWLVKGDVGRRSPQDLLYLRNFRKGIREPDGGSGTPGQLMDHFLWDASSVHVVDVYRTDVPVDELATAAPWPDPRDPANIPADSYSGGSLRLGAAEVEDKPYDLTVDLPDAGFVSFIMLVPRDEADNIGRIEYVRVEPASADDAAALPTIDITASVVNETTGLSTDLTVLVNDLHLLGGTLRAYVNTADDDSYTYGDPEDGHIAIAGTPALVGPTDAFTVPGGTFLTLHNIPVSPSRGKRIALEFTNSAGLSSGLRWFLITGGGGAIDENGNLKPGSINNATLFAAGLKPVEVYPEPLPARPDGTIVLDSTNGKLYKRAGGAWVALMNLDELAGQLSTIQIQPGAIDHARFASGLEPVQVLSVLPTVATEGQVVYLTTDDKLYRYTGSAWTTAVPAGDIAGQLVSAQIAAGAIAQTNLASNLRAVRIVTTVAAAGAGTLGDVIFVQADQRIYRWNGTAWTTEVPAASVSGQIGAAQLAAGAIDMTKLASNLRAVQVAGALPSSGMVAGDVVYRTTDGKLYRYNGTAWTADVPTTDLTGQITAAQITPGAVSATALASGLRAVQVVSVLPASATTGDVAYLTTDSKLYRYTGSAWTTAQAGADVAGLTGAHIAAGTLTQANLASNLRAVRVTNSGALGAGTLTGELVYLTDTGKLYRWTGAAWDASTPTADLTGTIAAAQIAANAVVAGKIAADAVTAGTIAAGAITARELAADSVTAGKIAAGSVSSDRLAVSLSVGSILNADPYTQDASAWTLGGGYPGDAALLVVNTGPTNRAWHTQRECYFFEKRNVPYDPTRTYRVRMWLWIGAASTGVQYPLVAARDASGGTLAYMYYGQDMAQSAAGLGWRMQETTFGAGGSGFLGSSTSVAAMPAGTVSMAPGVLLNWGSASATGDCYAAGFRIEEVIPGTLIENGAITTAKLVANAVTATQLAAGAVVAGKLAADAVTAGTIAAAAITARELAADSVTAGKVEAGAITASKLSIYGGTGAALNADPTTNDINAWALYAGTLPTMVVGYGVAGASSFYSPTVGGPSWIAERRNIPVDPNRTYRISGTVYNASANGPFYLAVRMLDATLADATGADGAFWYYPFGGFPPVNVWTRYEGFFGAGTAKPITNGVWMKPAVIMNYQDGAGSGTAGYYHVQDIRIEEVLPGTLIKDGAITTAKLVANAVTAAQIAAGAITAGKLAADAVTAGTIAAAAITARELAADSVTAGKIAAGSVVADKLAVSLSVGMALNADPLLQDITAWHTDGAAIVPLSAGNVFARAFYSTDGRSPSELRLITYDPAKTYRATMWFWAGATTTGHQFPAVLAYASDGTTLLGYHYFGDYSQTLAGAGWRKQSIVFGAQGVPFPADSSGHSNIPLPAGTRYMSIGALLNYADAGGSAVYMAEPRIEEVLPGTLIENGAITTAKLVAGAVTANELAAGAVTAGKITADAVTAGTIAAAAITARELAVDAVTAGKIAAGAVTAAKLTITDFTNLCENPSFENGLAFGTVGSGWLADSFTFYLVAANTPYSGNIHARMPGAAGLPTDVLRSQLKATCAPGDWFHAQVYVRPVGPAGSGGGYARISWQNYAGAELAVSAGNVVTVASAGTWVRSFVRAQAPANAATCRVELVGAAVAAGGFYDFDAVLFRRMGTGELVVDGTITATALASGSVTAGKLAAGAVTAGTIAAGAITATELAAGAVTAGKLGVGSVDANAIQANAIYANHITTGAILTSRIATGAVTANEIAAGAIVAGKIAADAVTAGSIAAGAINSTAIIANSVIVYTKLAINFLSEVSQNAGVIVNGRLQNISNTAYLDLGVASGSSLPILHHPALNLFGNGNAVFSGDVSATTFSSAHAYFSADVTVGSQLWLNDGQPLIWGASGLNASRITGGIGSDLLLRSGHSSVPGSYSSGGQPNVRKNGYLEALPVPGVHIGFGPPANASYYWDGDIWVDLQPATKRLYFQYGGNWQQVV